jgi:transposase
MLTGGARGPHSPTGDGALNAERFIAFLERLMEDAGQKVFLIVDTLKVHHAKVVKAWVERERLELLHLPAYAPEHNPDEDLNNDLKPTLRQRPQPASKAELLKSTRSVLEALQSMPDRIQSYFTVPTFACRPCGWWNGASLPARLRRRIPTIAFSLNRRR